MDKIYSRLPEMKNGQELLSDLAVLPAYDERIRKQDKTTRLIALSDIYNLYIPSQMSVEIYHKLYLSLLRSLQNKVGKNAVIQRNMNYQGRYSGVYSSVIGGTDSYVISGCSGLGKSMAISRAISLIMGNGIIETEKPYSRIIPCLVVQCPFDASVKSMLIEILRAVDGILDSSYYQMALKNRATTDLLIGMVSQVAINHVGLLVVDEIQNVVTNKNGRNLVGMLTQLINSSGIAICMVGTPECEAFFEQALHLARRSIGLKYSRLENDRYFYDFCHVLFNYQYTQEKAELTDILVQWLYEHSGGIVAVVVSLFHDAQEIAILEGKECLGIDSLNQAYKKRLSILHSYITPAAPKSIRQKPSPRANVIPKATEDISHGEALIAQLVTKAKAEDHDVITLLKEHLSVAEVSV